MPIPTDVPPPPAGAPARVDVSRLKLLLILVGIVIVTVVAWRLLTAPLLRITPAAAQTWMTTLDERIAKRIGTALRSESRAAINIDFGQKTVDAAYLANLNDSADQVKHVRGVLLERATLRFQVDLLSDIAKVARAMDGCGQFSCEALSEKVEHLTIARATSLAECQRLDGIMGRTYELARPDAVSYDDADSVLALHQLLVDSLQGETLLARRTHGKGFEDVTDYQAALWTIVDIHADLTEEYHRRHRVVTVLQMLLGRLP